MQLRIAIGFALAIALPLTALSAEQKAASGGANPATSKVTIKGPSKNPAALAADANSSYLACYFQKGTDQTWEWGLNSDGSYYQLPGSYVDTSLTKIAKFNAGSTAQSSMQTACDNAQTKNGLLGYSLFAYFAAASNSGSNYGIVANGVQLYPLF